MLVYKYSLLACSPQYVLLVTELGNGMPIPRYGTALTTKATSWIHDYPGQGGENNTNRVHSDCHEGGLVFTVICCRDRANTQFCLKLTADSY